MKRLFFILFMLLAVSAVAADATFAWDAAPAGQTWEKVRIYERVGAAPPYIYNLKAEVAGNLTTAVVQGVSPNQMYVARSYASGWESPDSNAVSTGSVPSAPGNMRITIVITVQQ
jgi:hypothetical protein